MTQKLETANSKIDTFSVWDEYVHSLYILDCFNSSDAMNIFFCKDLLISVKKHENIISIKFQV